MARVLVTGASGLLGGTLVPFMTACGHEVVTAPRRTALAPSFDLTRAADARRLLDSTVPEVIINLAAITDVDYCQEHPDEAYRVNAALVLHLVHWVAARSTPTRLIQLSTDQVYSGEGPHVEESPCPINVYAYSKCLAEEYVRQVAGTALRTNFFGVSRTPGRASFSDWIIASVSAGTPITLFTDVRFSPLSMPTLCRSIELVVRNPMPGVFNLGSSGGMSKADFALRLLAAAGLSPTCVRLGTSAAASRAAPRPCDMRMSTERFRSTFGAELPELTAEIEQVAGEYRHETR